MDDLYAKLMKYGLNLDKEKNALNSFKVLKKRTIGFILQNACTLTKDGEESRKFLRLFYQIFNNAYMFQPVYQVLNWCNDDNDPIIVYTPTLEIFNLCRYNSSRLASLIPNE
jgi:hypothetical protein